MTPEKRIAVLLGLLAEQSGEKVTDARLVWLAERLIPLGTDEVAAALERMLDSARKFPTVAEVKAEMGIAVPTARDEALLIADTVLAAIAKYGYSNSRRHAAAVEWALGPTIWELVKRQGGWNAICEKSDDGNVGVLRAQIRDLAESYLKTGVLDRVGIPKQLPSRAEALAAVASDQRLLAAAEEDRVAALDEKKRGLMTRLRLIEMQEEHNQKKGGGL